MLSLAFDATRQHHRQHLYLLWHAKVIIWPRHMANVYIRSRSPFTVYVLWPIHRIDLSHTWPGNLLPLILVAGFRITFE